MRSMLAAVMLLSAAAFAEAQHDAKPAAQAHGAPAEKAAAPKAKPADAHTAKTADSHATKPTDTHAQKPAVSVPAGPGKAAAPAAAHGEPNAGNAATTARPTPPVPRRSGSSVQHAVAKVMEALDREFGKPAAVSTRGRRSSTATPKANKIAVSWKMQLVWPEADPPSDPVHVQWPDPVLQSAPLRVSYVGFPK